MYTYNADGWKTFTQTHQPIVEFKLVLAIELIFWELTE